MPLVKKPSFSIGMEEEYLLVDRETRDLISEAPPQMFAECEALLEGQVAPEFLQCQIEVGTRPFSTIQEVRADLAHLRSTVAGVAEKYGLGLIAASTHPFAQSGAQKHTRRARYNSLARDLQEVARRLMISGMHVHVGIEDDDLRVDLMSQTAYVLPHLLALSTSSPFWQGRETGLMSYRVAVWDEMPRTGLPERFSSYSEYQRHIAVLVNAGVIEDATMLWWDVRVSARYPTLEMRISDVCTRLDDAICIASLYRCWLRMLYRLRVSNQRWREYAALLINENRWRAHRYGLDKGLIDFGRGDIVPYDRLLDEMLSLIREDAEVLDCVAEVGHARDIVRRGTSAHSQLRHYHTVLGDGGTPEDAMKAVVDALIEETVHGL